MCCIFLFKILQQYGTEISQFTSAPPPLGELSGQREIHAITMNTEDNKDNEINE